eukprot:8270351-Lingulodinium_polyedra.AAC.1
MEVSRQCTAWREPAMRQCAAHNSAHCWHPPQRLGNKKSIAGTGRARAELRHSKSSKKATGA